MFKKIRGGEISHLLRVRSRGRSHQVGYKRTTILWEKWLLLLHDCLLFRFLKTFLAISFNGGVKKSNW